jgi:lipopolysaccharide/colanic/teichoic acid biosynthesis glycosyltransferase
MTTQEVPLAATSSRQPLQRLARRAIDLVVAVVAVVILAPLLIAISLALFLPRGEPVLFAQTRLGVNGRPFTMYKFRKFHTHHGATGCPLTVQGDPRMTRIGRFLAATKLDELPQLWNVIRGDMAIVGPRPESLAFEDCFRNEFAKVLQFKPGLIGPSQVYFRHEAMHYPAGEDPTDFYRRVLFPAKAQLDLSYFSQRTIGSDIAWIARAFLAILGHVPAPPALHHQATSPRMRSAIRRGQS